MKESIEPLISKYLTNDANREELLRLEAWIQDKDNKTLFLKYIKVNVAINKIMGKYDKEGAEKAILHHIKQDKSWLQNKNNGYTLLKYAAVVVIAFGLGYFFKDNIFNSAIETTPIIVSTNNIIPGTDKATLTLGDGSQIALEKGSLFQTQHVNSNGEEIIYEAKESNTTEIVYNYLTIPRGGEYYVKLSDGTQVWLNSESQLKYPVNFIKGETRQVELVYGEAYFVVSSSTEHKGAKFIVFNQSQEVEVLGTEFNIKAYKDESIIYTTLVEGKVTVGNGILKQNLVPSQQSKLDTETNGITVAKVDVIGEISWRNGVFSFIDMPLKDIMKVMSRWYDVDVVFENKEMESVKFLGVIEKRHSIEKILSIMKSSSIKSYEINNKTIILK